MMRFTQSICVTVRGDSLPRKAPIRTVRHATTLIVIWNRMKRWIFRYSERPHSTACAMLANELSRMVISLASLATAVPSPIDSPTCALLRAGASLVPSPVTATTSPNSWSRRTRRSLSIGRARAMILRRVSRALASSSVRASNSAPVMISSSVELSSQRPICRAISLAVPEVSPVMIFTPIPASRHCWIASGTSLRTGSMMPKIPCSCSPSLISSSRGFS